jgi:hypothetical protein
MISPIEGIFILIFRSVTEEEGKQAANIENLIFSEVSAKTGNEINELFLNHIYIEISEKFGLKVQSSNSNPNPNEENKDPKLTEKNNNKNIQLNITEESLEYEGKSKRKCCQ